MNAPDLAWEPPSSWLLLRRGWFDPMLYALVAAIAWLAYLMADVERDERLEEAIGYSATRLAVIAFLALLFTGTVQGFRKRLVVYINDEATPGYNDALATVFLAVGVPLLTFMLMMLANIATVLLAPSGFQTPHYEDYCFLVVGIVRGVGLVWMYARLYAYNRGALSAFAALVTKLAWCLFAIHFLHQAGRKLTDEDNEGVGDAAAGFATNVILFFAAIVIIEGLTYEGPSLRQE